MIITVRGKSEALFILFVCWSVIRKLHSSCPNMSNLSNTGITRWSGAVTDLCHEVMGCGNYYFAILAAKQTENEKTWLKNRRKSWVLKSVLIKFHILELGMEGGGRDRSWRRVWMGDVIRSEHRRGLLKLLASRMRSRGETPLLGFWVGSIMSRLTAGRTRCSLIGDKSGRENNTRENNSSFRGFRLQSLCRSRNACKKEEENLLDLIMFQTIKQATGTAQRRFKRPDRC